MPTLADLDKNDLVRAAKELQAIRDVLGNGADENLWPVGLTLSEAVGRLVERQAGHEVTAHHEGTVDKGMDNPSHYDFEITPIAAIEAWDLNFSRGCVVKYIARAPHKGTELQDLEKALRYLEREVARVRASK